MGENNNEFYGSAEGVKKLTNITADQFRVIDDEDELDDLLETWLIRISSAINTRLVQGEIEEDNPKYPGITDIAERKCADLIAVAKQLHTGDIVNVNEFAVHILNTSQAFKDLTKELKPYQRRKVSVTWTGRDDNDE